MVDSHQRKMLRPQEKPGTRAGTTCAIMRLRRHVQLVKWSDFQGNGPICGPVETASFGIPVPCGVTPDSVLEFSPASGGPIFFGRACSWFIQRAANCLLRG